MNSQARSGFTLARRLTVAVLASAVALATLTSCAVARHTISGTVRGADGETRDGCAITAAVISGGPVPEIALLSGADGSFHWTVPAGEYEISALCPSGEEGRVTVDVRQHDVNSADIQVRSV